MSDKKKVVILTNSAESIILFRLSLAIELKNRCLEIIFCAPEFNFEIISKLNDLGGIRFIKTPFNRTGINPFSDLFYLIILYRLFKKERPKIVLTYTLKPNIYGSLAANLSKIPLVYSFITGFGSIFVCESKKLKFIRFLVQNLCKLSLKLNTKVFVTNCDILKYFVGQKILPSEKTILINGEGLDIDHYNITALPRTKYPIFLMIARLIRDKGLYEYLFAARQMKAKYSKTRFLLVGDLDSNPTAIKKSDLQRIIQEKIVEYLGKIDDVRSAIATSSVYVLPSYAEGIPRTVLEAMAMGRPIITTDAPGCREPVIDGKNGFLVPVKNVSELASAMENFIENPKLIKKMGLQSRKIAVAKYDVRKINRIIIKEIDS